MVRVMSPYRIRKAVNADRDALIGFTLREAREAECLELDAEAVTRGIRAAFDEPPVAAYWVAETVNGEIVASTSVVTEWSNFHGGSTGGCKACSLRRSIAAPASWTCC